MTKEKMTVHEALTVLKTLDKRIVDTMDMGIYVEALKHSANVPGSKTVEDIKGSIASSYDSVMSMIRRRAAIRKALADSNANTTVTIGGKTYHVSEAIEMKRSGSELLSLMIDNMTTQLMRVKGNIDLANNKKVPEAAEKYVTGMYGSKDKADPTEVEAARNDYIKAQSLDMIDPLNIEKKIKELKDELDAFTTSVDSALSVSNALTTIEFEY